MLLWLEFILCSAAIVFAGIRLSRYGDIIAEKTGMGGTWIGVVLMASVTSLPELVTGVSAVTYADAPDIAVGEVLGSCVFNMLILAFLDSACRPMPISSKAQQGHTLSAGFGILLLSLVILGLFLPHRAFYLGWIGIYSLLFIAIYFFAVRMIYHAEKKQLAQFIKEAAIELKYKEVSIDSAVRNYSINAVIVIVAAMFLPKIGAGLAAATGLGQSFVGAVLIAITTSLPEVVVSMAAVKMGAIDLAIGNLFGSNIFNILILGISDILFVKGPILSWSSRNQSIPALIAIMMTAVAIIGLTYRAERKTLLIAWDSIFIVLLYLIGLGLMYGLR